MSPSPELPHYSPHPGLTPDQHRVLALLAEGHSITFAAATSGVHRNTVRNWRRSVPAFACEVEFALREQALVWHEKALDLAPQAAYVLAEALNDPATPQHVRLRAALAILKAASDPQPRPLRPFPTAAAEMEAAEGEVLSWQSEKLAQSCTTAPIRKAPEPGRNSPCPCRSGQKYKRCCGAVMPGAPPPHSPALASP